MLSVIINHKGLSWETGNLFTACIDFWPLGGSVTSGKNNTDIFSVYKVGEQVSKQLSITMNGIVNVKILI